MAKAISFLLVMSVSPSKSGTFRRAGLEFSREWRAVQIGDAIDLNGTIPTLDEASIEKIKAEPMLVVKEASATDVETCLAQLADSKLDKDQVIAELQKKNGDLESRLMRLELAAQGSGKTGGKTETKTGEAKS